jgi:hypothetical protein
MTKPAARNASAIAALGCFAWPAWAVEPVMSDQTFEGLLADGYRLAGASTMQGVSHPLPFLFLAKEGVPAISMCLPQFRNGARLVDSASNPPLRGRAPFPPLTLR